MFSIKAHGAQVRKYGGEPYINHLVRVMETCKEYTTSLPVLAAALLHDVLEDTVVLKEELSSFLIGIMSTENAVKTIKLVVGLTDVFTTEDYPLLNRKKRKQKEAVRMGEIDPDAQTIKYADIIDNTVDITKNDINFAGKYLLEVMDYLKIMDKGHPELYQRAMDTVKTCMQDLKKKKKAQRKRESDDH
jgi:guanosine-3',5'-bis(diphosphate) 3'-pyrophosphohydrolase